jgi:hypothetical protein
MLGGQMLSGQMVIALHYQLQNAAAVDSAGE